MQRRAVLVVLAISLGACGGRGVTTAGETPTTRNAAGAIRVGAWYPLTIRTHCGVIDAFFDSREWRADPPLDDGNGNPPPGFTNDSNDTAGQMRLVSQTVAEFKSNFSGMTAKFVVHQRQPGEPEMMCE